MDGARFGLSGPVTVGASDFAGLGATIAGSEGEAGAGGSCVRCFAVADTSHDQPAIFGWGEMVLPKRKRGFGTRLGPAGPGAGRDQVYVAVAIEVPERDSGAVGPVQTKVNVVFGKGMIRLLQEQAQTIIGII